MKRLSYILLLFGFMPISQAQDMADTIPSFDTASYWIPSHLPRSFSYYPRPQTDSSLVALDDDMPYSIPQKKEDIFDFGQLQKEGNISRGLTFGSSQDVSVQSTFDLQLNGALSDNLFIKASISDQQIPIQPEGYTQQIQDIDNMFIQLYTTRHQLTGGDLKTTYQAGQLMRINKKMQGINYTSTIPNKKEGQFTQGATLAFSKGKYARNQLDIKEGMQGPYVLKGNKEEKYIVVIAGSEKVYVDGMLIQRGYNQGYTIDYNLAQITFTSLQRITKDTRVVVEFEYADQSYARSITMAYTTYNSKKWGVGLHVYQEQDMKSQPLQQTLTPKQIHFLSSLGTTPIQPYFPSIDTSLFDGQRVVYELIDTLVNGVVFDSVLVYTSKGGGTVYKASFLWVGKGKGDYNKTIGNTNGQVYEWVAPIQGLAQGEYAPITLLVTPESKRMLSLETYYTFSPFTKTSLEWGITDYNQNTFSVAKNQPVGHALIYSLMHDKKLPSYEQKGWELRSSITSSYKNKTFTPIERYQEVEYNRQWNVINSSPAPEWLNQGKISLLNRKKQGMSYRIETLHKGASYTGLKQGITGNIGYKGASFSLDESLLMNTTPWHKTTYLIHKGKFTQAIKFAIIGVEHLLEENKITALSLLYPSSFAFQQWGGFVQNPDLSKTNYTVFYKIRTDKAPLQTGWNKQTQAKTFGLELKTNPANVSQQLGGTISYRQLALLDTIYPSLQAENSVLGRMDYTLSVLKGLIKTFLVYDIGTGAELKKEYSYVQVAEGLGGYTWVDYNENGLKEINEFETAIYKDQGNYIKVYLPTNTYIQTKTATYNQQLHINPDKLWVSPSGIKKAISRFSSQSTFNIEKKTGYTHFITAYNPFYTHLKDTLVTAMYSAINQTIFFNRASNVFRAEYRWNKNQTKSLLNYGYEWATMNQHELAAHSYFATYWLLKTTLSRLTKDRSSDFFSAKNYHITSHQMRTDLSFQYTSSTKTSIHYGYKEKQYSTDNKGLLFHQIGGEVRYQQVMKFELTMQLNYIHLNNPSPLSNTLAYDLFEGLKPGDNMTWQVGYQQTIVKNWQLSFTYEGRKLPHNNMVHIGNIQVRAYF